MTVRDHYLEQVVESAGPEKLLILLVEGAVNLIMRAEIAFEKERFDKVNNNLVKAQNIYIELVVNLDLDAGEFAENLGYVYQYLYNLLIEANLEKDLEKIRTCLRLAEQIRDLWKETIDKVRDENGGGEPDAELESIDPASIPKTGVYEPAGESKLAESKPGSDDIPSSFNITG